MFLPQSIKRENRLEIKIFTGSMPMGYGPLNTPSNAGSNCKTLLVSSVANLNRRLVISFVTLITTQVQWSIGLSDRQWLPMTLTSSCLLFEGQTWAWHSSRSQTSWVTWRSSRCKWSQCRLRRLPSAGWCNAPQTPCWTSAARQSMRDQLGFSNMKNLCSYERKSTEAPNPVQIWEQW